MAKPTFSIIIPTLNEEHFIGLILKALTQQTYKNFEVIIVDNGSTDKTIAVVKTLSNKLSFPLKIVHCKKRGISYARNYGYDHASGKYLVFFDADGIPDNKWLESASDCLKSKPHIKALSGLYYYKHPTRWYKTLYYSIDIAIVYFSIFFSKIFLKTKVLPGNNLVTDKTFFKDIGMFRHVVCEDVELFTEICKQKKYRDQLDYCWKLKIAYSPRRFEKKGFWRTIIAWVFDFKKKKSPSEYDIYR